MSPYGNNELHVCILECQLCWLSLKQFFYNPIRQLLQLQQRINQEMQKEGCSANKATKEPQTLLQPECATFNSACLSNKEKIREL